MANRYVVTKPVPGGYSWYNIADTQSEIMPNFPAIKIHKDVKGAEELAEKLCESLNAGR